MGRRRARAMARARLMRERTNSAHSDALVLLICCTIRPMRSVSPSCGQREIGGWGVPTRKVSGRRRVCPEQQGVRNLSSPSALPDTGDG
mmetsp:Transcript_38736/g.52573  ORF Transcript_38736/g.52573 Transcript_38736/m.52573 type:complete len:89 (+) Transcript_38736:297-563(+)